MFIIKKIAAIFTILITLIIALIQGAEYTADIDLSLFNGIEQTAGDKTSMTIRTDKRSTQQTINGWGTSACWWSQMITDDDTREDIAKLLFSKEGLGLNIYRYNIGGGYDPDVERVTDPWRLTESFYYYNEETGQYEYDFTRDANAQKMLEKALSYGCIDTVVLFANSPHYSMTVTGQSSGGTEEYTSNLKKDCYDDYVDYLLTITEYFLNKGVPVKYISPINEPQWSWGGSWVGQEGCHYEPDEVQQIISLLAQGIAQRGLDVKICGPESGDISDTTQDYIKAILKNSTTSQQTGTLAFHSYWSDDDLLKKKSFGTWLKLNCRNRDISMTEWCELPCKSEAGSMEAALIMGRVISQDMKYIGVNSWSSWVAVNNHGQSVPSGGDYSDGLISASSDFSNYYLTTRYYAMAHYTKYIPTGSVCIKSESNLFPLRITKERLLTSNVNFSAYLTPQGETVIVIVNEGEQRNFTFDTEGTTMTVIQSDSDKKLQPVYSGKLKSITLPAQSMATIIIK